MMNNLNQQEKIQLLIKEENYKFWLGGFIEGEGSLTVSIVRNNKVFHGIVLQPEFNVTQIVYGLDTLYAFKYFFGNKGSIFQKSGSENVWVYSLKGTQNILQYIIPFFATYVVNYSSKYKLDVFNNFVNIINLLDARKNKTIEKAEIIELVKLVYLLNPDSKGKSRKRTIEEVIDIISSHHLTKP